MDHSRGNCRFYWSFGRGRDVLLAWEEAGEHREGVGGTGQEAHLGGALGERGTWRLRVVVSAFGWFGFCCNMQSITRCRFGTVVQPHLCLGVHVASRYGELCDLDGKLSHRVLHLTTGRSSGWMFFSN